MIVGGLTRNDMSNSVSKVPLLGDIPLLGHLFSSRSRTAARSTLFVFIRPTILRDDRFADLKYYSDQALKQAELPPNVPGGEPILMQ